MHHAETDARIIAHLRKTDAMSTEIAKALGIPGVLATQRLRSMVDRPFKLRQVWVREKIGQKPVYSLTKPVNAATRNRRYVPEFKYMDEGSYDLYAGRDLAMIAR